jgi:(heptosyl)LPS beta-1,4-glucosyltransferase
VSRRLSVVVCARNEEPVIGRCLGSVSWADELLVLDSGSTDATRERAAAAGARVHSQPWLGFSAQKNRAAALAAHDWVLSLDADEIVTPPLARSIQEVLRGPMDPCDGWAVDRRGDFLGVLLPNGSRPAKRRRFVRLYNRRHSVWDEAMRVHEEVLCPGRRHRLAGVLLHWNDYSLDELIALFNRYASIEAQELHAAGARARAAKVVYRPVLRFLWHYLATGDVRLGGRGVLHSGLKAASEYMRYAKLWELQHARAGATDRPAAWSGSPAAGVATADGQAERGRDGQPAA